MPITVAVAGASGRLGQRIVHHLIARGATVLALLRPGSPVDKQLPLAGAQIVEVSLDDPAGLTTALAGVDVVVSALNGLHDIIVEAQTRLLAAAVAAGVPRFIPSDYAADLFKLGPGENRNFDLRREFHAILDPAPIRSTSILNGGFMNLLLYGRTIDAKAGAVNYWGTPDQLLDYTTMEDTAQVAAAVALDTDAPKIVRVVGDSLTAGDIARTASEVLGRPFSLNRLGTLDDLLVAIVQSRVDNPNWENEIFPRTQQLEYTNNMQSGRGRLSPPLDNARYAIKFTTVRDLLTANAAQFKQS